LLLGSGHLKDLAIMKEYANRSNRFLEETVRHLVIAGGAVLAGVLIGVPLGILPTGLQRSKDLYSLL
jgi:osmoprotectant transport system permease protein